MKYLSLFFALTLFLNGWSQTPKVFPESDEEFLKTYVTYVGSSSNTNNKKAVEEFEGIFTSLSTDQKASVKKASNILLKKRARTYPTFFLFTNMINKAAASEKKNDLAEHLKGLIWVLEKGGTGYKKAENYSKFVTAFAVDKKLYASKTRNWFFEGSYTMEVGDKGPIINFSNATLTQATKGDSVIIKNATGFFSAINNTWYGKTGKVDFGRAGYDPQKTYCDLFDYTFNATKNQFSADSALLTFTPYVKEKVIGKFTDKIYSTKPKNNMEFPKFNASKNKRVKVEEISPEIELEGQLNIIGDRLVVRDDGEELALAVVQSKEQGGRMEARSRGIMIIDFQRVLAEKAMIDYILEDNNSIAHPEVEFKYDVTKRIISTGRKAKGLGKAPFSSSFYVMNIYGDQISWHIDSSFMTIRSLSATSQKPVLIESHDYYRMGDEVKYQMGGANPLNILSSFSYGASDVEVTVEDLTSAYPGMTREAQESLLQRLSQDGFIIYNRFNQTIKILDKANLYIAASKEERDYDNLKFTSSNVRVNGRIDLKNKEIDFSGVESFPVSRRKAVGAFPLGGEIALQEDRDIKFNGEVQAGRVQFIGKDIVFDYEGFKMDFDLLDTLMIYIPTDKKDSRGHPIELPVRTVISDISGQLFIDEKNNKSGKEDYPEYPYFVNEDTANVYYNPIIDGDSVYSKNNLRVAIMPFTFENLDKFDVSTTSFPGIVRADGIISDTKVDLRVLKNRTLGFKSVIPKPGIKIYDGKGDFSNNLMLNGSYLKGDGELIYKGIVFNSSDFRLFENTTYAVLNGFKISTGNAYDFPSVEIDSAEFSWAPKKDSLMIGRYNKEFTMFEGNANYNGDRLILNKDKIFGEGGVEWQGAKLQANKIDFSSSGFSSEHANFQLNGMALDTAVIVANHIQVEANIETNKTNVKALKDSISTFFPFPNYVTNAAEFTWDGNNKKVEFANSGQKEQYFQSLNPSKDSLKFVASKGVYDLTTNELKASGVSALYVADSKIIPPNQELTVDAEGEFGEMQGATLILNAEKEYHTIENASIILENSKKFTGSGTINLKTGANSFKKVSIPELSVKIDTVLYNSKKKSNKDVYKYSVYGVGRIEDNENFKLEDLLYYKGNLLLDSKSENIEFDGYAKLDLKAGADQTDWFQLKQPVDPNKPTIAVDGLKNDSKEDIFSGIMVNADEQSVYPAIMRAPYSKHDLVIHKGAGIMEMDRASGIYRIGSKETLAGNNAYGDLMTYNDNSKDIWASGKLDLLGAQSKFKCLAYGEADYKGASGDMAIKATIALDFWLDEGVWYRLQKDIPGFNDAGLAISYKKPLFQKAIYNLLPNKTAATEVLAGIEEDGLFRLPEGFPYKMLLTDVKLYWDPMDGSLKGFDKVGLSVVNGKEIDHQIKCYVEFANKRGGNGMKLLFKTTSGEWYFIEYRRNVVKLISSDSKFNDAIAASKNRQISSKQQGVIYEFTYGTKSAKNNFEFRMEEFKDRFRASQTK